jgi:hypothetical protein
MLEGRLVRLRAERDVHVQLAVLDARALGAQLLQLREEAVRLRRGTRLSSAGRAARPDACTERGCESIRLALLSTMPRCKT